MLRPLDAKLHYKTRQDAGEYFGKDCGKQSIPKGQGQNSGIIITAQDKYPCIIPYQQRQLYSLNRGYDTPKKGERPMHATTMQYTPVRPEFLSTTKHVSLFTCIFKFEKSADQDSHLFCSKNS